MNRTPEKGTAMKNTASSASAAKSGPLADLCVCLRAKGTGTPSPRAIILALVVTCLFLAPAAAQADTSFGEPGTGAGQFSQLFGGVATSQKEGDDVYVLDAGQNQRVSQFTPAGVFVRSFGWGVLDGAAELQTCTTATGCQAGQEGSGPGQLDWSDEIAVDNDPASPSYGDLYVVDQRNFRIEKYSPSGEFLLMFGGEVDHTTHADLCTAEDIAVKHDTCGAGVPGTGPGRFYESSVHIFHTAAQSFSEANSNSIAVGLGGTVYVGDFRRVQEFESDGTFLRQLGLPEAQFVTSLAVNESGHVFANSPALNESQLVRLPSAGTFTVTFKGQTTPSLPFDVSETALQQAIEGLSTVGAGNIHTEFATDSGVQTLRVYFIKSLGDANLPQMTASSATVETLVEGAAGELLQLGPTGEVLQTYDETGEPAHIALDEEGDLLLSDAMTADFRIFKPDGSLYAVFTSDQLSNPRGIAVGSAAGKLYATASKQLAAVDLPKAGPPLIKLGSERATDVLTTTATLHAILNPEGFETHYRFQYVTQQHFEAEGFANPEETPLIKIEGPPIHDEPVSVPISALAKGTVYHYRALAESECHGAVPPAQECLAEGPDQTFETLPPVTVRNFTTQTVAPEEVILEAELNPNGSAIPTHYAICYGAEAGHYAAGCSEGTLPPGNTFQSVSAAFTGLQPNTSYHYRLTATNENGTVETPDAELTTEETITEEDAAACPNALRREEDNSLALPDCRAYEQVSPTEKGGYPVSSGPMLSPSGERLAYSSVGVFAGAESNDGLSQYLAHRTPAGWLTQPMIGNAGPDQVPILIESMSVGLDRWVLKVLPGTSNGNTTAGLTYYMGSAAGSFLPASPSLTPTDPENQSISVIGMVGASADFSNLFIHSYFSFLPTDTRPEYGGGAGGFDRIYEVSGADSPQPTLRLAAEVPTGLTSGQCYLNTAGAPKSNASSADGSTLFYEAPLEVEPGAPCQFAIEEGKVKEGPNQSALFACDLQAGPCAGPGEHPALDLSAPRLGTQCQAPAPCASAAIRSAHFFGASPDASRAWFATRQPLVDSDADPAAEEGEAANDLYLARIANGEVTDLIQASKGDQTDPHPGRGAGLEGVSRISPDGLRAFFVATGVLTEDENEFHRSAVQGAANLYAYDASSGQTKFIADLCGGGGQSLSVKDPACPTDLQGVDQSDNSLWVGPGGSGTGAVQLTPDGRYLLFASFARLTPDDTDNARDVFRYDFQTGQLLRLSFGHRGNDANGNDDAYDAEVFGPDNHVENLANDAEDGNRSISSDGSTAIFRTAAPLVSRDTNAGANPGCGESGQVPTTGCDIYQWQESGHGSCHEPGGCISLISDGLAPQGAASSLISASGDDITFSTPRGILPGDTDGVRDIYDARVDGGFPNPVPPVICQGNETCHEKPESEPTPPKITTEGDTGGNGVIELECAKGKVRVKKHGQIRCVAKKSHKAKKHHKRAAGANRGGNK
jgi:hypothetical protein